jgi:hypothetical protein
MATDPTPPPDGEAPDANGQPIRFGDTVLVAIKVMWVDQNYEGKWILSGKVVDPKALDGAVTKEPVSVSANLTIKEGR